MRARCSTNSTQVLLDYVKTQNDRSSKVLDFLHPNELAKVFDFTIKKEPETLNQLIADAEKTLRHSVDSLNAFVIILRPCRCTLHIRTSLIKSRKASIWCAWRANGSPPPPIQTCECFTLRASFEKR